MNSGRAFFKQWIYPTALDKSKPLETFPHYTDKRFQNEQTVFGEPSESPCGHSHLHYDYSDRLYQFNYDRVQEAVKIANKSDHSQYSCYWYEVYLSAYYNKIVIIEHIIAGVNRSNGYPYAVYGYKFSERK